MRIGISTYTYGWAIGVPGNRPMPLLDEMALLDRAVGLGVRLVQFGDNLPLHELDPSQIQALHERAVREKITLEVGARGLTETHLQRCLTLCKTLESRLLRFVIDTADYEPSADAVVALLREAEPELRVRNITLGIENHDRLKAAEFADLIDRVGSPFVGICLDSVNSMGAGEGLAEVVATLAPYTVNLHLKDFGIARLPHLMGFQIDGRPAGRGMLNLPWLIETVRKQGRCQTAILEQWVVPENELTHTLAKETAWANESIQYLRTIDGLVF
ncbi:sugar phosphate isomerase/epimerase [Larkinella ripae]